jgi:hypothetical protein
MFFLEVLSFFYSYHAFTYLFAHGGRLGNNANDNNSDILFDKYIRSYQEIKAR